MMATEVSSRCTNFLHLLPFIRNTDTTAAAIMLHTHLLLMADIFPLPPVIANPQSKLILNNASCRPEII
jgi:hypothetical protein